MSITLQYVKYNECVLWLSSPVSALDDTGPCSAEIKNEW